ncbi:MAG: DNA-binding response regulator [Candidatus Eremiobacteraeota bacterium]|nr:DNA-binding response regulator [Candidatus Eremiobacteraeota bacterium]
MPPKTVLIADDEPQIVDILERYLSDDGFIVSKAYDGQAAADLGRSLRPDLVLLDLKLPLLSGFEVFRELRRHSSVELARNVGRTFTRSQLLDNVRGDDLEVYDRTLDRHIGNLRHKIEPDSANPRYIITVFGVGYKMVKN